MSNSIKIIIAIACVVIAFLLFMNLHRDKGINFADFEHSDQEKQFEQKLFAQQQTLDSLANIYRGKGVIVSTITNYGTLKPIVLYNKSLTEILDTIPSGETVQLVNLLHKYKLAPDSVPEVIREINAEVQTKKGQTGYIRYYFIKTFADVLYEKGLATDTSK
jgi:hypothetical protein